MTEETLLTFPCDFPLKIVGKANADFEALVQTALHKHFPGISEKAIYKRPSKDGNFLAITAMVHAESKAQLDAVYQELTASPLVLMML